MMGKILSNIIGLKVGLEIITKIHFDLLISKKKYFSAFIHHPYRFIMWCLI
jgi:hypothetical protein